MMQFNKSVIELIKERKSVRTFVGGTFPENTSARIDQLLKQHTKGPFGNSLNFSLIEKVFASGNQKVKIGTYGFISGAQYFIAGEIKNNPFCFEDYGYMLENIILHLTGMNLGTCWLGGTFNRKNLLGAIQSIDDVLIPAITPVGYISDSKTIRENIIRWAAKSNYRFEWDKLFFKEDFKEPIDQGSAGNYFLPLEMVRLAPSASNKQPWRIIIDERGFHFYLKRTPGYNKMFKAIDLQRVDMGIAMAHFELTCIELKLKGKWTLLEPEISLTNDIEYLISWKF